MKLRLALLATMGVVVGLSACGDPLALKATDPTSVDTLSVYALTGTPPSYPSALSIVVRQVVRVDGFGSFDVAFDINDANNAVIYPVRLVVSSPGGFRPVGLQKVAGTFDDVTEAPRTGYQIDSALVVSPGEVVVLQSPHNGKGDFCYYQVSPNLYAKITVDSINLGARTIKFRMGFDPNCGFRSFASGIPTS